MTVYAHIRTERTPHEYSSISFKGGETDVWFVTISQSLSGKTSQEIIEILNIATYGIWITTPYQNKFWVITNAPEGFNVQELASADLNEVYTMFEIDEALDDKADIEHSHISEDILDLNEVIEEHMAILSSDINNFLDKLCLELLDNNENGE